MSEYKVIFEETQFVEPDKSIGYHFQEICPDGKFGLHYSVSANLVDEHYVLEVRTFPSGVVQNALGVEHDREKARERIYKLALGEARGVAQRCGGTLEDKTKALDKSLSR